MTLWNALRAKTAVNKIAKQKSGIDVAIGVLTLISLVAKGTSKPTRRKKKPEDDEKWGVGGY